MLTAKHSHTLKDEEDQEHGYILDLDEEEDQERPRHRRHRRHRPQTPLDEQFCQVYYTLDGNCEKLRSRVNSRIRSGTPTLELGNFKKKPVLVFFHGWPDTHALWANQFAEFCDEDGEYACVAPSMMDYNPDVEPANLDELNWPNQADVLHDVISNMGLKSITLVMHDFGSIVGHMYVARYPTEVQRVVAMDVGNNPISKNPNTQSTNLFPPGLALLPRLLPFQQVAIQSFSDRDDTAMANIFFPSISVCPGCPPCRNCHIAPGSDGVGWRTGWMHNNWVNEKPPWTDAFLPTQVSDFEFEYTPSWPDNVPQLFLYGTEDFHQPSLLSWLDSRGDGSGHQQIGQEHWFMARNNVRETNEAMAAFFEETNIEDGNRKKHKYGKRKH